jgi:hypothetical protein
MRESRSSGSVRGAASNGRPYRDRSAAPSLTDRSGSTQPDRHISGYRDLGAETNTGSVEAADIFR